MKIGRRLQQIEQMVEKQYDHIWDCCCDHGLLGFNLLKAQVAQTIHFVDIVPDLLVQIEKTLQRHWLGAEQTWLVHCLDAGKLPIRQFSIKPETDKHLIIIAGIGGELLIELMQSLLPVCANYHVEFILCPVHHNYKLRQFLIDNQLGLLNECLVFENSRSYEILHLSPASSQPLSAVGSIMWDLTDPLHLNYLDKTIKHYQRIAKNPNAHVKSIINQYQQLR